MSGPLYPLAEFTPEQAATLARFEAAEPAPESWDQELWDAIAVLIPCHPEGDCEYSDECECTGGETRDVMYRLAIAERYRQAAEDLDDPEVEAVCASLLVSNPFYRGPDQGAAIGRVLALIDQAEDRIRHSTPPITAERLIAEGDAPTVSTGALRAAIAGES